MSVDKIQQMISSLAKSLDNNESLATPILVTKIAKCAEAYPQDKTIGAMLSVIEKMALNNNIFITKDKFKELYNKLYSTNTKFAKLFSEELGIKSQEEVVKKASNNEMSSISIYDGADEIMANAFANAFDNKVPLKTFSETIAKNAKSIVSLALDAWNLKPNSLEVSDGNEKFLVIKANYETPKGITSFYVPVQTIGNKICEASVFVGNNGPNDLNHNSVKSYIMKNAGSKLSLNSKNILAALVKATSEDRDISGAELALISLRSKTASKNEYSSNQILGLKIDEPPVKDVEMPKSNEFSSFENKFASPYGVASFDFGADKVKIARDCINNELKSLGFKNSQISVTGSNKNSVFYGVSLDTGRVAFTVPVKMSSKIDKPTFMICNGSMLSFDKKEIDKLFINNQTDFKVAAAASPLSDLTPADLLNNIRQAISDNNHAKAEDALNVLANSGNKKAYVEGFNIYLEGLSDKPKQESCCSLKIKNATTSHVICGHTGLPLHKTYQDKYGNCLPLYRRNIEESKDNSFNHKMFG